MNSPIPPSSPEPIRGPIPNTTRFVPGSGTGTPQVSPNIDSLGFIPPAPDELVPPPLSTTQLPPPPPISQQLEQIGERVDAIDEFGDAFGLSNNARRALLGDVDARDNA